VGREIFSYRWHKVVVCINVTFAFVIVPHCKAKSSKGGGDKSFSFKFCGKSDGKGDRTINGLTMDFQFLKFVENLERNDTGWFLT